MIKYTPENTENAEKKFQHPTETTENAETAEKPLTIKEIFEDSILEFQIRGCLKKYNASAKDFSIEYVPEPHKPKSLPKGKQAIYSFFHKNQCLYIGYAGAKSNSRFCSQHYSIKGKHSILAKNIVKDNICEPHSVKRWMKQNCWRVNIYIESHFKTEVLEDLRDFLKEQYRPLYGG